ncbi:MAG: hypothetical protein WA631_10145 [Nitrososphaeraceae archaeon]
MRTKWVCPNCVELSPTRHWSVERHIRRKHTGIGEPISINTHQTRTQMNIGPGWSKFAPYANPTQFNPNTNNLQRNVSGHHNYNNYFNSDNNYASSPHQLYQNNNTNFSAAQNNFNNEKIKSEIKAPRTEKRGIIDDETFKMFCQMVELKKFSGQNQLSSGLSASIGDLQQQFIGRQISGELLTQFLMHKNISDNNRNVGLRGRLCYNCCFYWIDLVYNNEEAGMKTLMLEKLQRHECDHKKVLAISKYNFQDLASKKNQAYSGLSDLFTLMVSSIVIFGRKPIYLYIEELYPAPQQQTRPLYRPTFGLRPSLEPQNDVSFSDGKRISEKAEQYEQQRPTSWIKEEDCINLGDINEIKESHWAYRAIKEEKVGDKKNVVIDAGKLIHFFVTTRATFGTFRVQMEKDASSRYFFMYFSISN